MDIKNYLRQLRWKESRIRPLYWIVWQTYNGYRFVRYPSYRSQIINRHKYENQYHQFSNFTEPNRYPDLFEMAQQHFGQYENPKLLSFGCSTGEEVATLAQYLPKATLVGADINDWCLKQATKKYPKHQFLHSLSEDFEQENDFDTIFCLAVFQNPENRHNPRLQQSAYGFEQFESQLIALDQKLKVGGLLFIDHCDFNFIETSLMPRYQIAHFPNNQVVRQRPIFNRKNQKIADKNINFRVFRKVM